MLLFSNQANTSDVEADAA